ncbi:hypothetical protein [Agrobacterium tumefaciens]|uniref:hypothetical protein n=1 Tax=Agrobacterium tumefaciens TaxID=358 RepID=UPI001CBC99E6|nr:hypothetical protein [Agrobacterium tumefaciens]
MFDLDKFDKETSFNFEEAFDLDITHPVTGEKTGLVVQVASYRSERVKRVQRKLGNASLRENKKNPKKVGTIEEVEERTNEIVAASIVGWNLTRNKVEVPCTPEEILKIISDSRYFFIAEQVDKAADEDANFTKRSPKS